MPKTYDTFVTLDELINSHLYKLDNGDRSNGNNESILTEATTTNRTNLEFQLLNPPNRITPSIISTQNNNEIITVLATQLANTLKARETKKQQDKQIIEVETERSLEIDFTDAIIHSQGDSEETRKDDEAQKGDSIDFKIDAVNVEINKKNNTKESLLLCPEDLSYLVKGKIKKAKCSNFGRVLCAVYKNTYVSYPFDKHKSDFLGFTLSTPAPEEKAGTARILYKKNNLYEKYGSNNYKNVKERKKVVCKT